MNYKIRNSKIAKNMKISIQPGGLVVITKPYFIPRMLVKSFVAQKKEWIEHNIKQQKNIKSLKSNRDDYLKNKEKSRIIILDMVKQLNSFYDFKIKRVSIKNQRTRWGSCSSLGNLSFNWQVSRLSNELAEYVVVHELCHLKEMNHSSRFWKLVSLKVPNYKVLRKRLQKNGINLI
ncbi:M48 family metallopeptidase [bacterium]|nr:M48 family metallopeptidase [bacterium]